MRRLWYDTVNAHLPALHCACQSWGTDRLLLGSDYPYVVGSRLQELVDAPSDAGLSAAEREAILGATAQKLLGIPERR